MSNNEERKKKHVFTWKVDNFTMCSKEKGDCIQSPIFTAKSLDQTSWCLELYPRGNINSDDGYISCFLRRKDEGSFEIGGDYTIEIIDNKDHTVHCKKGFQYNRHRKCWGWRNFIKKEFVKTALFDDTLFIRCTLCENLSEKAFSSQNIATTKFQISKISFQWCVERNNPLTHREIIKLPYSGSSYAAIIIQIVEDYVKICILVDKRCQIYPFLSCSFILLDVVGNKRDSKQATHLFKSNETWEFPTFIKMSQLYAEKDVYIKRILSGDDCFTLQCDITVSDGSVVEDIEEKEDLSLNEKLAVSATDTFAILNEDIKRMYVGKIHTDIKLKAGKEEFLAHKNILCARSPVFMAMFDNDMTESQKGEVEITDLEAETLYLFLEYIYTGTVSDLDYQNAMKLIVAAEKYQVLSLKNKCADLLAVVLSDENVCEILATADLVQHDSLKTSAVNYIKMRPKKIFNSEKWKLCVKNNMELATETVCEVSTFLGDQAN